MAKVIDTSAYYTVSGYSGIAWYCKGFDYEKYYDSHTMEYEETYDYDRVICVMVGDDREFVFDVDDLVKIDDEDSICSCGQIGCCSNA